MIIILICISVYVLTVLLWFLITAYEYRQFSYTIGDVIEHMGFEHFFPIYNTVLLIALLIAFIICIIFFTICNFFNKLWTKFINIKIKK